MPHCRCVRCGSRRTLNKLPENYLHMPRCLRPSCYRITKARGERQRWRVDHYRQNHERRGGSHAPPPCRDWRCDYHFPHRKGSLGCVHSPEFRTGPDPYEGVEALELAECPF